MKARLVILPLAIAILAASGCLVSGTFVVVEKFQFEGEPGFYFYQVDVTHEPEWIEHKDWIDLIETVGFEFWITNSSSSAAEFNGYVGDYLETGKPETLPESATPILSGLVVPPGKSHITYNQSLGYVVNLPVLRAYGKSGKFSFYGTSSGENGSAFVVDSGKVILTVSASRK